MTQDSTATPAPLHGSLEYWAERTPDAPALAEASRRLSYAQWNAQADALAALLAERAGVGRDDRVALCMQNRIDNWITDVAHSKSRERGFSLMELLSALAIIAVLAAVIVPRLLGHNTTAKKSACYTNQGDIELQVKLWKRNVGTNPLANLSNIGADVNYFPGSLPTCPVDGSAYTIDTTTGLVVGHTH